MRGDRQLYLDLTGVQRVDRAGRYLLGLLRCSGAHLVASGVQMTELVRTIEGLSRRQNFYVIFVSDQPYPMFYPQQEPAMVPATAVKYKRSILPLSGAHFVLNSNWP